MVKRRKTHDSPKLGDPQSPALCSCKAVVDDSDNALQCDACENWFHIACVNVSPVAYSAYQTLADQKQFSNWFCPKCLDDKSVDRLPPRCLAALSARIDAIERETSNISRKQDQLVDRMDKLYE
ncbi:unnamed protein product, partial [Didymodactylos carnosus]